MKNLKLSLTFVLMVNLFAACNTAKKDVAKFELNGTIEGVTDGKIMLSYSTDQERKVDTAVIKNGQFVFRANLPSVTQAQLMLEEPRAYAIFYAENTKMTLTGTAKEFHSAQITGGKEQEILNACAKEERLLYNKYKEELGEYYGEYYNEKTSESRRVELKKNLEGYEAESKMLNEKFIKENPTAYHSGVLVLQKIYGKSVADSKKELQALPEELQKTPVIVKFLKELAKKAEYEVSIDEMMANVNNVSYKVDTKFSGENLKNIVYMGVFRDNNICALKKDGTIQVFDTNGKVLKTIPTKLNGRATSLAVDVDNNIYLLCSIQEEVIKKIRGRKIKRMMPKGVECIVLDEKGKEKTKYTLKDVITATGARIVENNLVVADFKGAKLAMFDKTTGEAGAVMNDMRPCCGILDFNVNAKKEILVANLGAFRVQGFDFSGKQILSFGQRGKTLNDFHGCCNPVSVANLSNGAIVTVEKDPTRIKIYSKEGAKQIAGIEELVKGCSYIPMIVDSKDNLYLASAEKGIVKCVSAN